MHQNNYKNVQMFRITIYKYNNFITVVQKSITKCITNKFLFEI